MTFRKIYLTLLTLTLGVSCAYAKKTPKFEQAHQLTPEQAALVQKAVAQEKVLIKKHPGADAPGRNLHPGHAPRPVAV